jgi:hypothetical protein
MKKRLTTVISAVMLASIVAFTPITTFASSLDDVISDSSSSEQEQTQEQTTQVETTQPVQTNHSHTHLHQT